MPLLKGNGSTTAQNNQLGATFSYLGSRFTHITVKLTSQFLAGMAQQFIADVAQCSHKCMLSSQPWSLYMFMYSVPTIKPVTCTLYVYSDSQRCYRGIHPYILYMKLIHVHYIFHMTHRGPVIRLYTIWHTRIIMVQCTCTCTL